MNAADRKLLELAAKAAGINVCWSPAGYFAYPGFPIVAWDPLSNDGDALRLAVKLDMRVDVGLVAVIAACNYSSISVRLEFENGDAARMTCRAIVMAAAEIGKAMP